MGRKVGFQEFFNRWMEQHEANLEQLLRVPRDPSHEPGHRDLVTKVMDHYRTYYAKKSELARHDVVPLFFPPWLSSTERVFLWMGGWKPTAFFRLVSSVREVGVPGESLRGMSEEQVRGVEQMRAWTRREEEAVEGEMERVQSEVVVLSRVGKGTAAETEAEAAVMRRLVAGAERVAVAADGVRMEALRRVVRLLSPLQAVDFLAAAAMLQILLHEWGVAKDRVA